MNGNNEPFTDTLTMQETINQRGQAGEVATLTILYHSEVARIGEQAYLFDLNQHKTCYLARNRPEFTDLEAKQYRGLADPYISQSQPILLHTNEQGILTITPSTRLPCKINNQKISQPFTIHYRDLEPGLVITLANRVVLLLELTRAQFGQLKTEKNQYNMIGISDGIIDLQRNIQKILKVTHLNPSILIQGETGTGKELVANAIHRAHKNRHTKPFIAVNMATINESLAEAQLFGATKGSYTGSISSQQGYFKMADGGTLFLDELGDTPLAIQPKLLRVLQEKEIMPLGAKSALPIDIQLICATDANLEALAEQGLFRPQLTQRVSEYTIQLPPLRARIADIGVLLIYFLQQELAVFKAELLLQQTQPAWLTAAIVSELACYHWPGNIRQLRNVVRQLVINGYDQPTLQLPDSVQQLLNRTVADPLDSAVKISTGSKTVASPSSSDLQSKTVSTPKQTNSKKIKPSEISNQQLSQALEDNGFDYKAAAQTLGISRSSLYYLIEQHPDFCLPNQLSKAMIIAAAKQCPPTMQQLALALKVNKRSLIRQLKSLEMTDYLQQFK